MVSSERRIMYRPRPTVAHWHSAHWAWTVISRAWVQSPDPAE